MLYSRALAGFTFTVEGASEALAVDTAVPTPFRRVDVDASFTYPALLQDAPPLLARRVGGADDSLIARSRGRSRSRPAEAKAASRGRYREATAQLARLPRAPLACFLSWRARDAHRVLLAARAASSAFW